jgi:trigger factor
MQIIRENIAPQNDVLKITIETADYKSKVEQSLKKYAKNADLKGFRKGHAPFGMVKKMYGTSILADEVYKTAEESLFNYVKEQEIKILGKPIMKEDHEKLDLDIDKDHDYTLEFEIGYEGEFSIEYGKKALVKYEIDLNAVDIDKEIERVKEYFAKNEDSEGPIKEKDIVYFDIKDGEDTLTSSFATTDEMTSEGVALFLGKSKSDAITANIHNTFDSTKTNIEKYILNDTPIETEKDYTLSITNIKTRNIPTELSAEDIAKITNNPDKTSMEDLVEMLKDSISKQYERTAAIYLKNDTYEAVLANTEIPMPIEFLKRWLKNENSVDEHTLTHHFDDVLKTMKWDIISNRVARENEVAVSREEIREQFANQFKDYFVQMGQMPNTDFIYDFVDKNEMNDKEKVRKTYETIFIDKVLDKMVEGAKINVQKLDEEAFKKESERRQELMNQKNEHHHDH